MTSSRSLSPFLFLLALAPLSATEPFRLTCVDKATGRGVPLVELKTTARVSYWTDSAGVVAFSEPGLMNQRVWFDVRSHGYRYPADGLGLVGVAVDVTPGGSATIELERVNVAERLYRITGQGIYRDSVLLGDRPPSPPALLNAEVMGSDSAQVERYQGKLLWIWGDTHRAAYGLGNFAAVGAWSDLEGARPEREIGLRYLAADDGFAKKMCPLEGPGPVWIDGMVTLQDEAGVEHLVAHYVRVKQLGTLHEMGLARFNDKQARFEKWAEWPLDAPLFPRGHPLRVDVGGSPWLYFARYGPPNVRVPATLAAFQDRSAYQGWTCLEPGARFDPAAPAIERGAAGRAVWAWKPDTSPVGPGEQRKLIEAGLLDAADRWPPLLDPDDGRAMTLHGASVQRHPHTKRWTLIATEGFGSSSHLGEVWYAEADRPEGPWCYARKVLTHERYSFYNPTIHEFFSKGSQLYFEGTYTTLFSGNPAHTPRYDYNQILYRLDLADARLTLPQPLYHGPHGELEFGEVAAQAGWPLVFCAYSPLRKIPAGAVGVGRGPNGWAVGVDPPVFFALPLDAASSPTTRVLATTEAGGLRLVDEGEGLCRVWSPPTLDTR